MVLTTKQKINAYRYALREIKKEEIRRHGHCVCGNLGTYLEHIIGIPNSRYLTSLRLVKFFPEFKAKKPKKAKFELFWWDEHESEPRIKALKECIKELL